VAQQFFEEGNAHPEAGGDLNLAGFRLAVGCHNAGAQIK